MIFTRKPKSRENHGQQQWHRIHYNMSEYKTISKQTLKEEINERDKHLIANAQGRDQLQRKSLNEMWNRKGKCREALSNTSLQIRLNNLIFIEKSKRYQDLTLVVNRPGNFTRTRWTPASPDPKNRMKIRLNG